MPPKPKTDEEIEYERKIILDNALEIIVEQSINDLSMRTLAKKCNYSATKIYYYFECKADIVLTLIEDGFVELNDNIIENCKNIADEKQKLTTILDTIFKFSLEKSHYFNAMFGVNVPRVEDLLEEPKSFLDEYNESTDTNEKMFYNIFFEATSTLAKSRNQNCSMLHSLNLVSNFVGVVLLNHSGVLQKFNQSYIDMYSFAKNSIVTSLAGN